MDHFERAGLLRDKIRETWNPPRDIEDYTESDVAQTSVMVALAWIYGKSFLAPMTPTQVCAIRDGLEDCLEVLPPDSPTPAGQSSA